MSVLRTGPHRQTPADIIRSVRKQKPGICGASVRRTIREMVQDGHLAYTHSFSISHLERCFQVPVRLSPHLALRCQGDLHEQPDGFHELVLNPGASFGAGDHPTTRMALNAVDYLLHPRDGGTSPLNSWALDIGTGSGILALAAVALGMPSALALDDDPLACFEAKRNVALNRYENRIRVICGTLETVKPQGFGLIMANLRTPTLRNLIPSMLKLTQKGGVWALSGFRPDDVPDLSDVIGAHAGRIVWQWEESQWSALAIQFEF